MSDTFGGAADTAMEHAGAEAAGELARGKGPGQDTTCRNCGAALAGDFCHVCGQSAQSVRRPFWSLLGESVETLFAIDGRIARTLPDLIFRPGRMTRAYLDGQRARFIPPFRLYVLASLLFFILLPLVMGQGLSLLPDASINMDEARAQIDRSYAAGEMTEEEYRSAIDGMNEIELAWSAGSAPAPPQDAAALPEAPAAQPETISAPDAAAPPSDAPANDEASELMPAEALGKLRQAAAEGDQDAVLVTRMIDNPSQLAERTQEWIPRLMFVLLPVYACLLALTYLWRRQFLFYDHLIVSLHFHSALFFSMAVGMLAAYLVGAGWVSLALLLYSNWYLYRLNRAVYGRGRFSSFLRVLTLDSIYFCILMSALLVAVMLGALSL